MSWPFFNSCVLSRCPSTPRPIPLVSRGPKRMKVAYQDAARESRVEASAFPPQAPPTLANQPWRSEGGDGGGTSKLGSKRSKDRSRTQCIR